MLNRSRSSSAGSGRTSTPLSDYISVSSRVAVPMAPSDEQSILVLCEPNRSPSGSYAELGDLASEQLTPIRQCIHDMWEDIDYPEEKKTCCCVIS